MMVESDEEFERMMQTGTLIPLPSGREVPCIFVSDPPTVKNPRPQWFAFFLRDTPLRGEIEQGLLMQFGGTDV